MRQLARQWDALAQTLLSKCKGKHTLVGDCVLCYRHPQVNPSNLDETNQIPGRIWVIKSVSGQNKQKRRKTAVLRAWRNSNDQQFQHLPCRDGSNYMVIIRCNFLLCKGTRLPSSRITNVTLLPSCKIEWKMHWLNTNMSWIALKTVFQQ